MAGSQKNGASADVYLIHAGFMTGLQGGIGELQKSHSAQLRALGKIFSKAQFDAEGKKEIHQDVGKLAQNSVVAAYAQRVTRKQNARGLRDYPVPRGNRDDKRALFNALKDNEFFEGTPTGISFANADFLDRRARQWYRLNFGALPRGRGSSDKFQLRWSGQLVASLGFDAKPSQAFGLPPGFWLSPDGRVVRAGGEVAGFYPTRRGPKRDTRGIVGANFLEAGLNRITEELPRAYREYYDDLYREAQDGTVDRNLRTVKFVRIAGQKITRRRVRG